MMGGYLAAIAILGALHQVRNGGGGQHLDVSLYNATLMLQQIGFAAFFASGREPEKTGSAAPYACPNEAFPTADGWVMVAAYHPERWRALCEVMGAPALEADPRFTTNDDRVRHRAALHHLLAARFVERTTAEWLDRLAARDILCAPVATYGDVVESAEYAECGLAQTIEHPIAGPMRTHGFALGPSDRQGAPDLPAPLTGQHTLQVLEKYGFAESEIAELLNAGVIRVGRLSHATRDDRKVTA
jgi:crotonobetainyl-CoA:carnitine CoA-transferase CaiB-like acyl-CoA transferase